MSQQVAPIVLTTGPARPQGSAVSFLHHAKLISGLTLLSRVLGVLRESLAAKYFGAGVVSTAFTVAFTIPNLFRRLFGEGALSAAFIPLYSQAVKGGDATEAAKFAAASVKLLTVLLLFITAIGELLLLALAQLPMRPEYLLAVKLTAIMLPYMLLVCGTAFLGAILQVHRKFGLTAAAPIVLNITLIVSTVGGAMVFDTHSAAGQLRVIYLVSISVLFAGVLQVLMLLPSLRAVGFRFDFRSTFWTSGVKKMLLLSIPVALSAGVMQLLVLMDRGISFFLAGGFDQAGNAITHFELFGQSIRYPMAHGAAARLAWAQYLYQFPLGVFAIALATAIFPMLSADALEKNKERFRDGLRKGIGVAFWEGLPASIGLILVAQPVVQVLFERGRFTETDTALVASSVRLYAIGIWAFSIQQILNRAYYALHDTRTPLVMSVLMLVMNLAVELPLIWTGLGESGMAAGTSVSFMVQCLIMIWVLQRKTGSLDLRRLGPLLMKVVIATAVMAAACLLIQQTPIYPKDSTRQTALLRLAILMMTGAGSYLGACAILGVKLFREMASDRSPAKG